MNDRLTEKPPPPGRRASIALAVAVHVLLAVFLIYGIRWQSQRPEAVEVELVRALPAPAVEPPPQAMPEPEPKPKPEPKPEPKPAPPPPKPEIAIKEKSPKEKVKRPPKETPPPKWNPFQQQVLEEDKRLAAQRQIDEDLRRVETQKASQAAAARNKAQADYSDAIRAKIRGNVVLPPDLKGNPTALFEVNQLPSGEVISAKLLKGSGNAGYDAAVERAILKSSPLPKPRDASDFQRTLKLTFCPNEGGCN